MDLGWGLRDALFVTSGDFLPLRWLLGSFRSVGDWAKICTHFIDEEAKACCGEVTWLCSQNLNAGVPNPTVVILEPELRGHVLGL